ncbi:hypothetical protein PAAG_02897 [Paracoccidioides lutzii Pb01]|uniref:Uncharacterized protein n=1 Tax=Paracoccidioides lutzii (strain ATCC MYA-826 / Pb01) TaxID=502779 RepID=C1GWK2_PARBA|nr:hypothetical protein PAAG_02897 [Paracoccidioides lutzii Pb01]EEH40921.2 hypothetical protein PAAG_02897 [Paracoccidioides lutzii Pb01]
MTMYWGGYWRVRPGIRLGMLVTRQGLGTARWHRQRTGMRRQLSLRLFWVRAEAESAAVCYVETAPNSAALGIGEGKGQE